MTAAAVADLKARKLGQAQALESLAAMLRDEADQLAVAPQGDPMLTVAEAARELRRSVAHVRAACAKGQLRAMNDGTGYRIRRSALEAYERRRTSR